MNKIQVIIYISCLIAACFVPLLISFLLVTVALTISTNAVIRLIVKNEMLKHFSCLNAPTCPNRKIVDEETKKEN